MTCDPSPREQDMAWLDVELPDVTEDEREDFTERVGLKVQDVDPSCTVSMEKARREAKIILIQKRRKRNAAIY